MADAFVVRVSRRVFEPQLARLEAFFTVQANQPDLPVDAATFADQLSAADAALITGGDRIDETALAGATRLKVIATASVGHNHIDLEACARRGIVVTNTPDVLTETTADFGFALMMAAARRIGEAERWMRQGYWQRWAIDQMTGPDVYGSTLGILGMGRIGQAIARRATGFSMRVIYHNRRVLPDATEALLGASWCDFDSLFERADHLIVVLPYSPEVHHLIGARELLLMKPSATLTNIARGGIIDEIALAAAVRERRLAAIGLDVFEGEPKVATELLALDSAVLTPHIASASLATRMRMADLAVDNIIEVLSGRPARTPVSVSEAPVKRL